MLIVIAIAYLPVWTFFFSLKNDFFTQYFLQRFFIGQSVTAGKFPRWNPYFNYGLPVYNDMNGGFWYPATWINAIFSGYNAYSFTIEEALHFPIAGLGMYFLAGNYKLNKQVKIIAAISYACGGYFVAHTQHYNWITGAAWLPWCLLAMFRQMEYPGIKNLALGGLVFIFFLTGSHPGLIIGGMYFFVIMAFLHTWENKDWRNAWKPILALLAVITICLAGMIYSYVEIIPLFTRSQKIPAALITVNAIPLKSFLSFLIPLPFARTEQPGEEITMNNLYMGLLILVSIIAGLIKNRKRKELPVLAIALFFLLISANFSVSVFLTRNLPLLQYVRLSGELRIFGILPLLIYGSLQLNYFFEKDNKTIRRTAFFLALCVFMALLISLISHRGSINVISGIAGDLWQGGTRPRLKEILHHMGFMDALVIQLSLQVIVLLLMAVMIRYKPSLITWIVALDLIMASLLNMPFTGVSMRPVSDIQAILNRSPEGFPAPSISPEKDIYLNYPHTDTLTGNWSFYSKQIAIDEWSKYPMVLKNSREYFDSSHQQLKKTELPYVFCTNGPAEIKTEKFSPSLFHFDVLVMQDDSLVIRQNLYPGWITKVNDQPIIPDTAYYAFPKIALQKGRSLVSHEFRKPMLKWLFGWYWSCMMILGIMLIVSGTFSRNRS